jgi:hypothetical protein
MSVYPGNILTATAATVNASPTSTRTWQWFRSGTAIPAATASGYVVTTEDIDALLTVKQGESNFLGVTSATSAGVGPVETYSPAMLFALNEPGVWYDPSDVANLNWRTNQLLWTQEFDNSNWTRIQVLAVGVNAAVAPDGTTTADRLIPNTVNDARYVAGAPNVSPGFPASMTHSVYVKPDGYGKVAFRENATTGAYASFDATTGTVLATGDAGAVTVTSPTITSVGNGWYRISAVFTASSSITQGFSVWLLSPSYTTGAPPAQAWVGDGTSGVFLWGAQLELGSVATTYQPITTVGAGVIARFPNATLYQDDTGTALVTTPGQTVGLMLDKSKGLVLGTELVANGTFDSGITGWTQQSGAIAWDAGRIRVTDVAGADGEARQPLTLAVGRSYQITYTITTLDATNLAIVRILDGVNFSGQHTTVGTFSGVFTASATNNRIGLVSTSTGLSATFDNISVKELPGNHAVQATFANRPLYGIVPFGGRRNLLTQTNDLTNLTNWPTGDISLGSRTGAGVSVTDAEGYAYIAKGLTSFSYTSGTTYTFSATVVCDQTIANAPIRFAGGFGANAAALVNLQAGVSQRISITATATSSAAASPQFGIDARNAVVPGGSNATGYVVTFSDPQIELNSTATPYQRVTTQYDVTEAGVQSCSYLFFNGSNNWMETSTITPGTDKAQVFAGARKNSDTTEAVLVEFSTNSNANNGSFQILGPDSNATSTYRFYARGDTASTGYVPTGYAAPISNVLSALLDLAGADRATEVIPRINGFVAQVGAAGSGASGAGNFLAYPLYLGRRNATTNLYFNGNLFSLITRFGANLDATTINATEYWVGDKTGINIANNISPTIFARDDTAVLDRFNQIIERRA